jgi:SAM-dependent methyltransferase
MHDLTSSAYDPIAGMYHALWADWYLPAAMPALERLFFSRVRAGANVLDVCCGSGHVTKELVRRGYEVTGIDSSAALIELARKSLPGVDLRALDARVLKLNSRYDAAISTFDSLNHMMSLDDFRQVLARVHGALHAGGAFVFDMNLEEAYTADLRQWTVSVTDGSVGLIRGTYDFETRKAATELIWFHHSGPGNCWRQHSTVVEQRCYLQSDIEAALLEAGFRRVEIISARDAGVNAELGFGRIFVTATA